MNIVTFLQTATSASTGAGLATSFIPLILIIAIFYFFIIRPQNKKQKETEKMLNALKKGDKIITIGGIHGVVSSVKEKTVIVKVDDNTKIEFNRSAVSSVESDEKEVKADNKADKKSKKEEKSESEEVKASDEE